MRVAHTVNVGALEKKNRDSCNEFRRRLPSLCDSGNDTNKGSSDDQNKIRTRQQILEERANKIRDARERYFKRRGVDVTQ